MKIYNYHPLTSEYLNSVDADESPLEPGVFMIPAFATDIAPPNVSGSIKAVFSSGSWTKVPDHRGEVWFDAQRSRHEITELGATPSPAWVNQLSAADQLDVAKQTELAAVDRFHAETVQQLAGNPLQVEKDTWAMKLATAHAVVAKATVSGEGQAFMVAAGLNTPTLQVEWAAKVQANAVKFAGLVGLADSLRSQARTAINVAVDQAALYAAVASNRAAAAAAIAAFTKA